MEKRKQDVEFDSYLDESVEEAYEVLLADEATYSLAEIPSSKVYSRICALIDFLSYHPYYGEEYDPYYDASFPPIDCRVFFCARYGIYYHVFQDEREILVLAVEDTRKSPLSRFGVIE